MQQVLHRLVVALCLAFAMSATLIVVEEVVAPTPAYAQAAGGLGRIESKVSELAQMIQRVLQVFVIVAIAFVGFKFIQGDPNAWKMAMMAIVGAVIIYGASELVTWLST